MTYQQVNTTLVSEETENEIIKSVTAALTAFKNKGGVATEIKKASHAFIPVPGKEIITIWANADVNDMVIYFTANYLIEDKEATLISHKVELVLDDKDLTEVELIKSNTDLANGVTDYQVEINFSRDDGDYVWKSKSFRIKDIDEAYFNKELNKLHDVYKKIAEERNVKAFFDRLDKEDALNQCPKQYSIETVDPSWDDLGEENKDAKIIRFKVKDSLNNYIKFNVIKKKPTKNDIKDYEGYANIVEFYQTEFDLNLFGHDVTIAELKDNTYEVLDEDGDDTDEILNLDYDLVEVAVKLAKKIYEKEYGVQ